MFSGSVKVTIDDKGRLAIPTRFRAQLAEEYGKQLAVTLGPECTKIYPVAVFRAIADRIPQITDRNTRMSMQRLFLGNAVEQELDAQGRMAIPALLRERMDLAGGGEAVLVGQADHFELWSEAQWNASTNASLAAYGDAFAALNL